MFQGLKNDKCMSNLKEKKNCHAVQLVMILCQNTRVSYWDVIRWSSAPTVFWAGRDLYRATPAVIATEGPLNYSPRND